MTCEDETGVREPRNAAAEPEPAPGAPEDRAGEHWRSVLGGLGPREILARLLQGDPLGLRRRVAERLERRAYLFDVHRVHLRTLAHCARYGVRYRGTPPLETWLVEMVDHALLDLLREDVAAERRGAGIDAEELSAFTDLARPLGLDPATMRRACLAHNLLPEEERHAFHALVVAGRGLEDVARAQDASAVEIARRARRGLETVLIAAGQLPRGATGSTGSTGFTGAGGATGARGAAGAAVHEGRAPSTREPPPAPQDPGAQP